MWLTTAGSGEGPVTSPSPHTGSHRPVKAARWLSREQVTIPTAEAWLAIVLNVARTSGALAAGLAPTP